MIATLSGTAWEELLEALRGALTRGGRRALSRLARSAELEADDALRELAALPAQGCQAVQAEIGVAPAHCSLSRGCEFAGECPLLQRRAANINASALGRLVEGLGRSYRISYGSAPVGHLAAFRGPLKAMLEARGLCDVAAPPRARSSLVLLDLALERGGPIGLPGPFLSATELEQLAAFIPPGSGISASDAVLEAWIRQGVCRECALLEWPEE